MPKRSEQFFSTGELGDLLGLQSWKISRLFESGLLEEPSRVAGRRLIPQSTLPEIIDALRDRGWLTKQLTSHAGDEPERASGR